MTDLKCSVTACTNNDNMLCRLNNITVGGQGATSKNETVCDSFYSITGAPMNSTGANEGRMETEVRCEAVECKYNDEKLCSASYIYVQGNGSAENNTRCDTFKAEGSSMH